MKKWLVNFIIVCIVLFAQQVNGQIFTQSFVDKCTGEIKIATTTYVRGNAVVSFYNQVRTFTPIEVQSGILNAWLQTTHLAYSTLACPTNIVVQQTVQQAVSQAAAQAAAAAASAAAQAAADAAAKAASDAAAKAAAEAAA